MKKRIIMIIISILLVLGIVVRIWYVNNVQFKQTAVKQYGIGEEFLLDDMTLKVTGIEILTRDEIVEKYSDEIESSVDDKNIIIDIEIKNNYNDERTIELSGIALFLDDKLSGGNMNPFLWSYLNDQSSIITLNKGESTVMHAPYPYGDYKKAELIFRLYPEKIKVLLVDDAKSKEN